MRSIEQRRPAPAPCDSGAGQPSITARRVPTPAYAEEWEDDGAMDDIRSPMDDEDWPFGYGAARLGIP